VPHTAISLFDQFMVQMSFLKNRHLQRYLRSTWSIMVHDIKLLWFNYSITILCLVHSWQKEHCRV